MDAKQGPEAPEVVDAAGSGPEAAAAEAEVAAVEAVGEPGPGDGDGDGGAGTAEALRELVLKAHPEVVPEMVAGETLEDLLASLPAARAAYQRISESLARPDPVPAGGTTRGIPADVSAMPAEVKIREGLKTG